MAFKYGWEDPKHIWMPVGNFHRGDGVHNTFASFSLWKCRDCDAVMLRDPIEDKPPYETPLHGIWREPETPAPTMEEKSERHALHRKET